MNRDPLSDLLRNVRFRGAAFQHVGCRDAWSLDASPSQSIARAGASTVVGHHMIAKGSCWAEVAGLPPVQLSAGDVVVFPHGDAHRLSSTPLTRRARRPTPIAFHDGAIEPEDSADTVVLCGFLECDLQRNPLAVALPRILHLPASKTGGWLERAMTEAGAESRRPRLGSNALLERLSEMMFVDAVRRYLDSLPDGSARWLAGLRDEFVGRTLAAMHADPSAPWTVEKLGKAAGIGRSALHERFVHLLGYTPMHYLTQLRMQVASNLLQTSKDKLAAIAGAVGYDSAASFHRAFKRETGRAPATWRRERLAG